MKINVYTFDDATKWVMETDKPFSLKLETTKKLSSTIQRDMETRITSFFKTKLRENRTNYTNILDETRYANDNIITKLNHNYSSERHNMPYFFYVVLNDGTVQAIETAQTVGNYIVINCTEHKIVIKREMLKNTWSIQDYITRERVYMFTEFIEDGKIMNNIFMIYGSKDTFDQRKKERKQKCQQI